MWIAFLLIILLVVIVGFAKAMASKEETDGEAHAEIARDLAVLAVSERRREAEALNAKRDEEARRLNPDRGRSDWS